MAQVIRALHQRDLRRRFEHAAARSDRSCADELKLWRGLADSIEKEKPPLFNYRCRPLLNTTVAKDFGDALVRALVFFPGADIVANSLISSRARSSSTLAYPCNVPACRNHDRQTRRSLVLQCVAGVIEQGRHPVLR